VIGGKKRVCERIGKRTIASYLTDKITVIECVDVFGRRGFGFFVFQNSLVSYLSFFLQDPTLCYINTIYYLSINK
jgi:hypothetical protein